MGGLGNGRRGGRSPPLMIAALIACILVLGFNYWVSSSRNLELQTKLYELEGQVRRGVAERGAAEVKKNEFQEEIQKQKEQINQIENFYKKELDTAQISCSQEKAKLQQNISSSTKTIQELKGQLNQMNDDSGKLQKQLQSCQGHARTQCESRIQSQKEMCDEKLAAAKLDIQKKMEKLVPPAGDPSQDNTADELQTPTALGHTESLSEPKGSNTTDPLTNISTDKYSEVSEQSPTKDLSKLELQSVPLTAAMKKNKSNPGEEDVRTGKTKTSNDLTEDRGLELMEVHEEGQTEEADPGMEGMLIDPGKQDETPVGQKLEEPDEYDGDEQVVGGVDLEKQQRSKQEKEMEEELADYNGDDENEGEFEADKQIELAQI